MNCVRLNAFLSSNALSEKHAAYDPRTRRPDISMHQREGSMSKTRHPDS